MRQPLAALLVSFALAAADAGAATFSDAFNRSDSLALGSPWVEDEVCPDGLQIVAGEIRSAGTYPNCGQSGWSADLAYWNAATTSDQYSRLRLSPSQVGFANSLAPAVRLQGPRATASGYCARFGAVSGTLDLMRVGGGVHTLLGRVYGSVPLGSWLEVRANAASVQLLIDGKIVISVTDASPITGGKAGVMRPTGASDGGPMSMTRWTDWEGGDLGFYVGWDLQHQDTWTGSTWISPYNPPSHDVQPAKGDQTHTSPANEEYYGLPIRRLTDASAEPLTSGGHSVTMLGGYSTQNRFNADESYITAGIAPDGGIGLVRLSDLAFQTLLYDSSGHPMLAQDGDVRWDRYNKNILYYLRQGVIEAGTSCADGCTHLRWRNITTGTDGLLARSTDLKSEWKSMAGLNESDLAQPSADRGRFAFLANYDNAGPRQVFVVALPTSTQSDPTGSATLITPSTATTADFTSPRNINWLQITADRVVVGYNYWPGSTGPTGQATRVYDHNMNFLAHLGDYIGHEDVGVDANLLAMSNSNDPAYASSPTCISSAWVWDLNFISEANKNSASVRKCLRYGTLASPAFPWELSLHIAVPDKQSRWAYLSFYRSEGAPNVRFTNEIVRVRLDGGAGDVADPPPAPIGSTMPPHHWERLAHGHFTFYDGDSEPHASVNKDGSKILFISNFKAGNVGDTYLLTGHATWWRPY